MKAAFGYYYLIFSARSAHSSVYFLEIAVSADTASEIVVVASADAVAAAVSVVLLEVLLADGPR